MPHSDKSLENISRTLEAAARQKPAIASVLRSFESLFRARQAAANELAELLPASLQNIPAFSGALAEAGVPMLAETVPPAGAVKFAAEKLLSELFNFPAIKMHRDVLENFFLAPLAKEDDPREAYGRALLKGMHTEKDFCGIPADVLDFVSQFVYSAVLRAMTEYVELENGEPLWDKEGAWKHGYCPFCGSFPVIAWLDKPKFDAKNEFLAGGGGKKHYYCSLCGSSWKFRRGVCPACSKEGEDAVNVLNVKGKTSERIDWCGHCKAYCPTADLRELADFPDMDALALAMLHLDMVAVKRKLNPLKSSFWNKF